MSKFIIFFIILIKCADANYDKNKYGREKIGKPYEIRNKKYYPKYHHSLNETGIISWYGEGDHGKPTANGAKFNKNSYTVAHKTLQLPSIVEVTNLETGAKVIAVVNDRGPFAPNQKRILDVSQRIARELNFEEKGTINGRVRLLRRETEAFLAGKRVRLGPVSSSRSRDSRIEIANASVAEKLKKNIVSKINHSTHGRYIHVGSFKAPESAKKVARTLRREQISGIILTRKASPSGEDMVTVKIGPVSKNNMRNVLTKLKSMGYHNVNISALD